MNDIPETVSVKKNRWFYGGLLVAVLNPILSGVVVSVLMILEPGFKKEGRIILAFSIIWGAVALLLTAKYGPSFR